MGIRFWRTRRIEVDHIVDACDVDATCCDIRRDQNVVAPCTEAGHCLIALRLGHIALQSDCVSATLGKLERHALCPVLRSRKDDRRLAILTREHALKERALTTLRRLVETMLNASRRRGMRKLDDMSIVQNLIRKRPNRLRHGRREEQVLSVTGKRRKDLLDVGQEAHIKHVIGFVEHERIDSGHVELSLTDQVEDTTGTTDDDLGRP